MIIVQEKVIEIISVRWIETGLKTLGRYSPGSARSYLIYWSKDDSDYKKYGKLLKDSTNDQEANSESS